MRASGGPRRLRRLGNQLAPQRPAPPLLRPSTVAARDAAGLPLTEQQLKDFVVDGYLLLDLTRDLPRSPPPSPPVLSPPSLLLPPSPLDPSAACLSPQQSRTMLRCGGGAPSQCAVFMSRPRCLHAAPVRNAESSTSSCTVGASRSARQPSRKRAKAGRRAGRRPPTRAHLTTTSSPVGRPS